MIKVIKDRLSLNDDKSENIKMPKLQPSGLWAKTKIMASYDEVEYDKNGVAHFVKKIPIGISALGETLFSKEKSNPLWTASNMVPIGGCQFVMEMLFGVKAKQFGIPTLKSNNDIGSEDSTSSSITYDIPGGGTKPVIYNPGNLVQLFGIGITGTAENDVTVYPVDYRENSIDINRVTNDGLTLTGTMIPFRHTQEVLTNSEKLCYFGKKSDSTTGDISYYLKRFEQEPVIKHIWKTGEDIDSEVLVSSSDIWSNNVDNNAVESFTECVLKITKDDVKEWFTTQGQSDRARINTIALFTGQYDKATDDYRDVRMFSKLNIPVEHLSMTKDLNLIYRVYTS